MLYSDINTNDSYKRPEVIDLDSVIQSISSIIKTRKTEVLYLPDFGFERDDYLFDIVDDTNAIILFQDIVNNITFWDDRVLLDMNMSKVVTDIDNNAYKAFIYFKIKGFTERFSVIETVRG